MNFIISKLIAEGEEIKNSTNRDYVKIGEWTAYSTLTIEKYYKNNKWGQKFLDMIRTRKDEYCLDYINRMDFLIQCLKKIIKSK